MNQEEIFIIGANGQLGTALRRKYPAAKFADIDQMDITKRDSVLNYDWSGIKIILNAAAYTNVDGAETAEGRVTAWQVNAQAVSYLAQVARQYDITLVHVSTDYVFDGSHGPHKEDEPLSPLGVYAATKAAADIIVGACPKHYILRTSFVIGEGHNFVRIMLDLGKKGVNPSVIADQQGRITFTSELVRAIDHLLSSVCPFGTYNVSNSGEPTSWAGLTRAIFEFAGLDNSVTDITTAAYYKDKPDTSPRPLNSVLDLTKIEATGFKPVDWQQDLKEYVNKEMNK